MHKLPRSAETRIPQILFYGAAHWGIDLVSDVRAIILMRDDLCVG